MTEPNSFSALPAWLEVSVAAITGGVIAVATMVKLGFNFNSRLQRIENQDLEKIIGEYLERERHDKLYPMLSDRVFRPLDKMEDEMKELSQNMAVLMERDRMGQRMEKLISALNQQALKSD